MPHPSSTLPSGRTQFTAQFVWPVTTTSTSESSPSTRSRIVPEGWAQLLYAVSEPAPLLLAFTFPPSCRSTMIVSTPCSFNTGTSAFTVSASSKKLMSCTADCVTIVRRRLERHADDRDLHALPVVADLVRREDRLTARLVADVRREEVEVRARERACRRHNHRRGGNHSCGRSTGTRPADCRTACAATRSRPRRTRGCRRRL